MSVQHMAGEVSFKIFDILEQPPELTTRTRRTSISVLKQKVPYRLSLTVIHFLSLQLMPVASNISKNHLGASPLLAVMLFSSVALGFQMILLSPAGGGRSMVVVGSAGAATPALMTPRKRAMMAKTLMLMIVGWYVVVLIEGRCEGSLASGEGVVGRGREASGLRPRTDGN